MLVVDHTFGLECPGRFMLSNSCVRACTYASGRNHLARFNHVDLTALAQYPGQTRESLQQYRSSMVYIAAVCDRCPSVSMVDILVYFDDLATCACGGALDALLGRTYPSGDCALFRGLSGLVDDSGISGHAAADLAERLAEDRSSTVQCPAVLEVCRAIPRTIFTLRLFDAHPQRLQQAVAMLAAILAGRARARQSEEVTRRRAFREPAELSAPAKPGLRQAMPAAQSQACVPDDARPDSRRHG